MKNTEQTLTNQNRPEHTIFAGEHALLLTPAEELLIANSHTVLGPMLDDVFQPEKGSGTLDDLHWNRTELMGKQQPVALVDVTLPDGSTASVVFRPTHRKFQEYYESYPAIRDLYPKLYMSTNLPYGEGTRDVLVLKKLNGFHGDYQKNPSGKEYQDVIGTPEGFEQMCQESFEAIEKVHELPLAIYDLDPRYGHNFIYNTETGHFQLFDIDTLRPSDDTPANKFMRLMQANIQPNGSFDASIRYVMRMFQLYLEAHPDETFRLTAPATRAHYEVYDDTHPLNGEVLYPGTDEYEIAFRTKKQKEHHTIGSYALRHYEDYPSFIKTLQHGVEVTGLDPDMLAAIKDGDAEKLKELIHASKQSSSNKLTKTEFIES